MSEPAPIASARAEGRVTLTEAEGKELLRSVGIDTPTFSVCGSADAAVDAATEIGYPVVVKLSAAAVTHKSDWAGGVGVGVGLEDAVAVRDAATTILEAADERGIDADVLVESAVDTERGTEVIVGGLRDPSFGPVVLTGLGGVFTEIFDDTSHRIAPIDHAEARAAVEDLQAVDLLRGYRGNEPADIDALAAAVVGVGNLVVEHPIAELDVNPVLAGTDGVIALDALVVREEH
ncbi:MAG: acetate--CoA ligase family protein [Halobellus sp.]|uniref:acetate--CoA ligase family protein n=1 Tax=Halobellus sp. TaxID=1979212 RepID=UPI0035D4CDE6